MKKPPTVLFISDVHTPFEDKLAVKLIRRAARDLKPDVIIFGGDIDDHYEASRFMKRRGISEDDLYLNLVKSREWLRQWREEHPKARMVKIDGNHEERFVKYVCSKAPILRDFVKQPKEVLQLNALKIKHQPTGSVIKIGKLLYAHGDQFMGGWGAVNPAKTVFDRTRESMLVGHVHKFSTWRHRGATGVQRGVWTNGCLCDIQEYDLHPQWQWGATLVKYVPSGNFRVHPMEIVNGELVYSTKWVATS